jgi:septum formation protein
LSYPLLVLASSSRYRSELLSRLRIPFETASPNVDESPMPNESAQQTSSRLSRSKALAVATHYPDALIIGSDQVALLGSQQLGKPQSHSNAVKQLRSMSGKKVSFYTALTLLNSRTQHMQTEFAINHVHYRELSDDQIENYLRSEQPYDCAGSCKSEGLGIALISKMEGDDPNALIGLPLILLVNMLLKEDVAIF